MKESDYIAVKSLACICSMEDILARFFSTAPLPEGELVTVARLLSEWRKKISKKIKTTE